MEVILNTALMIWGWLLEHLLYINLVFSIIIIFFQRRDPRSVWTWLLALYFIPVFGIIFYLLFGQDLKKSRMFKVKEISDRLNVPIKSQEEIIRSDDMPEEMMDPMTRDFKSLILYNLETSGSVLTVNNKVQIFTDGQEKFESLRNEMRQARRFIHIQYYIIKNDELFDSIVPILLEKVKEGVEVRVMYDGMCCLMLLPYRYPKVLEGKGIRCKMFSPIKPTLSTYQNNRDHRKIVVIDGQTAFTGGVNLADEYINRKVRFGHWKDTAVMLKGDAVNSFTMMFLQMWNVTEREQDDFGRYVLPRGAAETGEGETGGFVLPYGDSPMDREQVGERVYLDILNQAKNYVHIMTPYLILDDEMENALCYAAKRGIDVAIIMPHIPDKKYAYLLARTYYPELIEAGVKIYEYTPGFVHAKVFVSDDEKAVVGTINLDFRSLYLHFECAAYIYRNPVVLDVEKDYQDTLMKCSRITMEDCRDYSWGGRKLGRLMRLVAPLM